MGKFLISNTKSLLVNLFLLFFLLIGIQNNKNNVKIAIFNLETVKMPISFIAGSSFIIGSVYGNLIFSILKIKKK